MSIIFKVLRYLKKHSNLIKNIIVVICASLVFISMPVAAEYKSLYEEQQQIASESQDECQDVIEENEQLNRTIKKYEEKIEDKDKKITTLKKKLKQEQTEVVTTTPTARTVDYVDVDNTSKNSKPQSKSTYSEATTVWNYLTGTLGLNKYVSAGIMGNIMAEVGGQTLDFSRWSTYSQGAYYGICQWGGGRRTRLLNNYGSSLEAQLKFLGVELYETIPKSNSFYKMQNEKEAALYFAKYYERCSSAYYSVRQSNATKALDYFS